MKLTILTILLAICILLMYTGPVESGGGEDRSGEDRGGEDRGGEYGGGRGGTRTGNGGSRVSISGDGFSSGNGTLNNITIAASIIGGGVGAILLVSGVALVGYYIFKCCRWSIKQLIPARKPKTEVNSQDVKGNYEYNNKIEEECPPPYEQYKQ